MTHTTAHLSISLDGFVAGPDQSREDPLGRRGPELHTWHIGADPHPVDVAWTERLLRPRGAYLMGRNMFGPVRGRWADADEWRGWWGEDPPYHAPVVVLTHHDREPLPMDGGTTFHFCTGGFDAGLALARELGEGDVDIAGGGSVVRQALERGELDELTVDLAPVVLGTGERLLPEDPGDLRLEQVEVEASPLVTHVRYRVVR